MCECHVYDNNHNLVYLYCGRIQICAHRHIQCGTMAPYFVRSLIWWVVSARVSPGQRRRETCTMNGNWATIQTITSDTIGEMCHTATAPLNGARHCCLLSLLHGIQYRAQSTTIAAQRRGKNCPLCVCAEEDNYLNMEPSE